MSDFQRQPLWYKDAVIYEVHVKSFCDATGSGKGDLQGLISKLDFIKDLGVTALWMLPLYPSPLRDDGYDISDYMSINPMYGNLDDFRQLLDAAHERGLYVISELVLNHTSDQHPWFQKARRAPPGSPERDFYVWSDNKEKYREARIIFKDFEPSNWSWDPVAKAYYWHRFYSHQPDLNFDNPAVHDALFEVMDFWLGMGVDGMRLDAIPYLYEREGTSCENLPETHAFLRKISNHVRAKFDNRMLLAEANQWPEDSVAYFGTGDSCDMAFHFPLMPRLYMAVEMADRFPIIDILEQTPAIPDNCQWAIFLRNHDELTLEMVTDEERDYMYRVYARDERARINLGIRRRLAPLMEGNRRKIELMVLLLLSLPGTPVLYYGDEIGMGDNIYLGDRDGVRTPMQWSPDRNAGFSRANAQKLYLPVIVDPEYHYETVNVENQERSPSSLLWWMRRRLHLRHAHSAFRRGTTRFLMADNTRVLAFLRDDGQEAVLVVANLSAYPQSAEFDLSDFAGCEPFEISGNTRFPSVRKEPYLIMLGSYDVYWLRLNQTLIEGGEKSPLVPDIGEIPHLQDLLLGPVRDRFESEALLPYLQRIHWFEGRMRLAREVIIRDGKSLAFDGSALLIMARVVYLDGPSDDFTLVLGFAPEAIEPAPPPTARLARMTLDGMPGWIAEGYCVPIARDAWLQMALKAGEIPLRVGKIKVDGAPIQGSASEGGERIVAIDEENSDAIRLVLPDTCVLRWLQVMRPGERADLEIIGALEGRFMPPIAPSCLARITYKAPGEEQVLLGYVQDFVRAERDGVAVATEHLQHALERIAVTDHTRLEEALSPAKPEDYALTPVQIELLGGTWVEFIGHLGHQLAALHLALADRLDLPAFAPEPYTMLHQHATYHGIRSLIRRQMARVSHPPEGWSPEMISDATELSVRENHLLIVLKRLIARTIDMQRIRIHGNLGLERLLFTGKDFVFTGFDGEPWRPYPERRFKFCALRDIASLQHSLQVTATAGSSLHLGMTPPSPDAPNWAHHWANWSGSHLLDAYLKAVGQSSFLPKDPEQISVLLSAFRIERATYEFKAFFDNNPLRVQVAVNSLLQWARDVGLERRG